MNELKNDKNLREAVSRREQKLPPLPADLNERLMQRLEEPEPTPVAKQRPLWLYAAIAVAASIALLIIFHFGQAQTPQEPIVAQSVEKTPVPEPVEGAQVEGVETLKAIAENPQQEMAKAEARPTQKPVKKQRKVVTKLVELIPTSEAKSANVKELPASLIANVKSYDQASDPWRTTGIDDAAPLVARTTGIDNPDPLVTMTAQVEDIRSRGQRLQKEILQSMQN
jgi:hypothetical protein